MKRFVLFAVFATSAYAQLFGVGNTTEVTQLLNNAQLVGMSAKQIQQLTTAIQTYQEIVRTGQRLTNIQWTNAAQDIAAIGMIAQQGQGIAFSMAALDRQFQAAYPGYSSLSTDSFPSQYQKWSQTALDTMRGTLTSSGASWQQMQNEQAMIRYFQGQAGSLNTQMQSLQLGNVLGAESLSQMNKLRQLMLADMQSKQAYQAYQVQKDVSQQQYEQNFFALTTVGRDGKAW